MLAFDIRAMPDNLTDWELGKKLIIVCKKEDDNLAALSDNLLQVYPQLAQRKTLIIDDEADFASVGYRRTGGIVTAAVIPVQIDTLRQQLADVAFLQVTATPYSLYLQPDGDIEVPHPQALSSRSPGIHRTGSGPRWVHRRRVLLRAELGGRKRRLVLAR